jgi:hypothetical protein
VGHKERRFFTAILLPLIRPVCPRRLAKKRHIQVHPVRGCFRENRRRGKGRRKKRRGKPFGD